MDYIILFMATVLAVVAVNVFRGRLTKTAVDLISGFTGAFVLGIIVFHMLPEAYEGGLSATVIGFCIMGGLLIQAVLDFFTKGVDHGHTHTESCTHSHRHSGEKVDNSLTIGMFVSLFLHTFLESTPILAGDVHGHDHAHGILDIGGVSPLLLSIALHTIPMAIVLYILVLRSVRSKTKAMLLMLLFGLSGPLGMFVGAHTEIFHEYYYAALAVVVGILLHVSSVMLFDCDMAAYGKVRKLVIIVLGFIAAMLVVI